MFDEVCGYLEGVRATGLDAFTLAWAGDAINEFLHGPDRSVDTERVMVYLLRDRVSGVLEIMNPAAAGRPFFEGLARIVGVEIRGPSAAPVVRPRIHDALQLLVIGGYNVYPADETRRDWSVRPLLSNFPMPACRSLSEALGYVEAQLSLPPGERDGQGVRVRDSTYLSPVPERVQLET